MTATILVVDDEPDLEALVLQKFRRQIRDGAVAFVFAHDGIEALASIEQHPHVDMVVSDINMPRMDGLSLLQKLQEAEDKKSTIIVSAYGDMSNIRTAMNRGRSRAGWPAMARPTAWRCIGARSRPSSPTSQASRRWSRARRRRCWARC
jgi:CheY-like chemotaxis protein